MKRTNNIYNEICDKKNILTAIELASKHKTHRKDVKRILKNKDFYTEIIYEILVKEEYIPHKNKEKIIKDKASGKERIIHIPKFFPDQIIHWALMNQIKPIIMKGMYAHTCGSVPNRGQSHGQKYLRRWLDNDVKNTKYCLKMDISKFYQNINHQILKRFFSNKIKDSKALDLIFRIIDSNELGLPIGNYTSQWFSNFFLQDFDNFIKQELKIKYYIRYVDDLVLLGGNKKKLHRARILISDYLCGLGLKLKNDWQVFPVCSRPIDFLGFKFYRNKKTMRRRNSLRIMKKLRKVHKNKFISKKNACSIMSYMGFVNRSNSINFKKKYFLKEYDVRKIKEVISNESKFKNKTTRCSH